MEVKISVIIPTYNRAKILPRAIKSVLNQSFEDFELIVVDDGSTDKTKEIVQTFQKKDLRVKYIWQKNSGAPARPKNRGIREAKGEYLAFLDDDDEWEKEKLEEQIRLFESQRNLGFVGCDILIINERGERKELKEYKIPKYSPKIFFERLLERNFLLTSSSIMVKKEIFNEIGFFDENLKVADDWDMWLRISKKFPFDFVSKFLIKYYIHQKSITPNLDPEKEAKELEYIFEKHRKDYAKYPRILSVHLRQLASRYCAIGEMKKGRRNYINSIKYNPFNLKSYFYYTLSWLGKRIFRNLYYLRKSLNA